MPRPTLVKDIPSLERFSRELLLRAANAYFDALDGDNGKIAAFADDCVRHENGYQTVNNPPPGGRMMPGPQLPNVETEQRRALVIDEQKGLVAIYPLSIHDGTRRGAKPADLPGMLQNLVTVETFGIPGGLIHEVEVFPFERKVTCYPARPSGPRSCPDATDDSDPALL